MLCWRTFQCVYRHILLFIERIHGDHYGYYLSVGSMFRSFAVFFLVSMNLIHIYYYYYSTDSSIGSSIMSPLHLTCRLINYICIQSPLNFPWRKWPVLPRKQLLWEEKKISSYNVSRWINSTTNCMRFFVFFTSYFIRLFGTLMCCVSNGRTVRKSR